MVALFLVVDGFEHIVPLLITRMQPTTHLLQVLILIQDIDAFALLLLIFFNLIQSRVSEYLINLLLRLSREDRVLSIVNFDSSTAARDVSSILIFVFFLSDLFHQMVHVFLLFFQVHLLNLIGIELFRIEFLKTIAGDFGMLIIKVLLHQALSVVSFDLRYLLVSLPVSPTAGIVIDDLFVLAENALVRCDIKI